MQTRARVAGVRWRAESRLQEGRGVVDGERERRAGAGEGAGSTRRRGGERGEQKAAKEARRAFSQERSVTRPARRRPPHRCKFINSTPHPSQPLLSLPKSSSSLLNTCIILYAHEPETSPRPSVSLLRILGRHFNLSFVLRSARLAAVNCHRPKAFCVPGLRELPSASEAHFPSRPT